MITLTRAQRKLLTRVVEGPAEGLYIYGGEVRAARTLEKHGLIKLVDDGTGPFGGNQDGERWSIELRDRERSADLLK